MPFYGDYHTHTVFSHGHGSIEDNVKAAIGAGFKEIAITDHGFFHDFYGLRRMDLPTVIAEVRRLRPLYPQIRIYLGIEANLVDGNGRVDIKESDYEWLDLVVCGYHKCIRSGSMKGLFGFNFPNLIGGITKYSLKRMIKNTDAYIKALEKYKIDIISHPNYGIKTDVKVIAEAAAHYGTMLELNGKKVSMTDKEIESILSTDAMLIVDSDAHDPKRVGDFTVPLSYVDRLNIPEERIANYNKLPRLRRQRESDKQG